VRVEVGEGFVAAAYRHRMSRAEDPQLHTHVVAANMARGADGRWTALDATPIYQHAKAAGYLYQAHLRAAVRDQLPWVRWGPVRNGMAEIEQIAPAVLREFSTRRLQIVERERELVAAGVDVRDSGREAIAHATRGRKRYGIDTAPWRDVVRARAAEHGLSAREVAALVLGPVRAPEIPDPREVGGELAGASGLTQRQNTFAKRETVMAWAAPTCRGHRRRRSSEPQQNSCGATTCTVPAVSPSGALPRPSCSPSSGRSWMARRRAAVKAPEGSTRRSSTRCS
jgi:hypothetical protein